MKNECEGYQLSDCCGAIIYTDMDICSDCKEHCDNQCEYCDELCEYNNTKPNE